MSAAEPDFRLAVRVYHEDTDGQGVVYHANFLRYLERARTEWLRSLGWGQRELAVQHGVVLVVRRAEVDFLRPAFFDEKLEASVTISALRRASLLLDQTVTRTNRELVSHARVRIACIDAARRRPRGFPDTLFLRLRRSSRSTQPDAWGTVDGTPG